MQFQGSHICLFGSRGWAARTLHHTGHTLSCMRNGECLHQAPHLDKSEGLHDDHRVGLPARPCASATCSAPTQLYHVVCSGPAVKRSNSTVPAWQASQMRHTQEILYNA